MATESSLRSNHDGSGRAWSASILDLGVGVSYRHTKTSVRTVIKGGGLFNCQRGVPANESSKRSQVRPLTRG